MKSTQSGGLPTTDIRSHFTDFASAYCSGSLFCGDRVSWGSTWSESPFRANTTTLSADCRFYSDNRFVPHESDLFLLTQFEGGLQFGSIVLIMLGTRWYVVFNVIAGTQSFPAPRFEAVQGYKLSLWQRWQTVILPENFPSLITGLITAVGEARIMPV